MSTNPKNLASLSAGMEQTPDIDPVEEMRMRTWARRHYTPVEDRSVNLHPIVLDEMIRKDQEGGYGNQRTLTVPATGTGTTQKQEAAVVDRCTTVAIPIDVRVFDPDVSLETGQAILSAAIRFAKEIGGFQIDATSWEERSGSYYSTVRVFLLNSTPIGSIGALLTSMAKKFENAGNREGQSQDGVAIADAASKLIHSLDSVQNAVVGLGPIVIVKQTIDGVANIAMVPLHETLNRKLSSDPGAFLSPDSFFRAVRKLQHEVIDEKLQEVCAEDPPIVTPELATLPFSKPVAKTH